MKRLLIVLFSFVFSMSAWADNFMLKHGEAVTLYSPKSGYGSPMPRAEALFQQDYQEVFGAVLSHTVRIEEARIIACSYDSPELQKYTKLRGLNFSSLAGKKGSFILKVHNNGKQLFVVGSDDQGTAFGLMTLSREWGVSPFRWWDDAPALPQEKYELGVAYEHLFSPSIPYRNLILNACLPQNERLQEILLRLRATGVSNVGDASPADTLGTFRYVLYPSIQPYLGLSLSLHHPELIRLEALRAYQHGYNQEWQLQWDHQFGGELQTLLFFDMAWDLNRFAENPYAVDELEDQHYKQMSGLSLNWSHFFNDFYDLVLLSHPEQPMSVETLRRTIGESQQLCLQLSMDMSEHTIPADYAHSFFRNVEYPVNMVSTQMQRLCNLQLVRHESGNSWSVDDCRQRMELLASQLPDMIYPKWRELMNGVQYPTIKIGQSLMKQDGYKITNMQVGSDEPLPTEAGTEVFFRSKRAVGTEVKSFAPMRLNLNYQSSTIHLRFSLMPTRNYGSPSSCLVYVDNLPPQVLVLNESEGETQQIFDLVFNVDPIRETHDIVFRTPSDGIYLQRVWLCDMK